jgi:tripartite-type tricarboxylate transporter receptor subunit TctC
MSLFPSIPTFTEQGYSGFDIDSWIGVYTTGKTPNAITERLSKAIREITRLPEVHSRLLEIGFDPLGNTPPEFVSKYKADYPRISELIKAAGVTLE